MRRLRLAGLVCLVLAAAAGGAGWWAFSWFRAPGPLAAPKSLVIARTGRLEPVGAELAEAGIITHPELFAAATWFTRRQGEVKAGEYAFTPGMSPEAALALLRSGKTVVHRLVVPEGLTSAEIVALVEHGEALADQITDEPGEGQLEPETYFYSYGDKRQALIDRMKRARQKQLAELWAARDPEIPLKDVEEAVTLASIVEKETSIPAERPKIAAVFYNRLRLGMKLQADPTVIYAVTGGKRPLDRALTKPDLAMESPYNTYQVQGLPPGPIGNPGRAAIEAVLKPDHSDALYFVADGTGGHAFAATLDEHNKNVARWRQSGTH
ncbi:MAG TPA: endolytic transglycosylase MltG [Aliidongia sp.]|nr:endolytic transglycosylase MltG [Aliidongia sp.]